MDAKNLDGLDNPIKLVSQDRLNRASGARNLALDIQQIDASEGFVVGISGPWGSGKTSFANMVKESLSKEYSSLIIDFNPWFFSGAEELLATFLRELSAQLEIKSDKFADVVGVIDEYGELLSPLDALPVVGGWFSRARGAASSVNKTVQGRRRSVSVQKEKVSRALAASENKIIVFVDDIDRLEDSSIRDLFKLVRLTANFPNVIYVLLYDASRVEKALSVSGFDGRAYLEKIILLTVDLPKIPEEILVEELQVCLTDSLNSLTEPPERFDRGAWPDVLFEIISPLIGNLRDVKRYVAAVRSRARNTRRVELVDVLALEALRIFMPSAFDVIRRRPDAFTTTAPLWGADGSSADKDIIEEFVAQAGTQRPVAMATIRRIFPAALRHIENNTYSGDWKSAWLNAGRVAHLEVLNSYLEQASTAEFETHARAEEAFRLFDDELRLQGYFDSLPIEQRNPVVGALRHFESKFTGAMAESAAPVLLNLIPVLPRMETGMFDMRDSTLQVKAVVAHLLDAIETPEETAKAIDRILPRTSSLQGCFELASILAWKSGPRGSLVNEVDERRLNSKIALCIREAPLLSFAAEPNPLRLLVGVGNLDGGGPIEISAGSAAVNQAVLLASRTELRRQSLGHRTVHREPRLQWDALETIYGGQSELAAAIDSLRGSGDPEVEEVVRLADAYLGGWRPKEWGEE